MPGDDLVGAVEGLWACRSHDPGPTLDRTTPSLHRDTYASLTSLMLLLFCRPNAHPMTDYRVEKDFLGELKVPKEAYWGAQTQRAIENFPISGIRFGRRFIYALGLRSEERRVGKECR